MGIQYKSDRPDVKTALEAGGWNVSYGDEVDSWEIVLCLLASVIPGGQPAAAAWVEYELTLQLDKFGQALDDFPAQFRDQVLKIIMDFLEHGTGGEWDVDGMGVKAGGATYRHWWRIKGVTGWNNGPPSYQPYIGFRLARPVTLSVGTDIQTEATVAPKALSKTVPKLETANEPPTTAVEVPVKIIFGQ